MRAMETLEYFLKIAVLASDAPMQINEITE